MFRRIFLTALLAGFLGGVGISVVQEFTTTPVILHAEEYENRGAAHKHGAHTPDNNGRGPSLAPPARAHEHGGTAADAKEGSDAEAWSPGDGLERTLFTTLANVLTGIGFALVLTAFYALSGKPVNGRTGVLWGLAGFGAVSLAPSLGLPPEVPGALAAELGARQSWWFLCVVATAAGLWMMVFRKSAAWAIAGIVLIALPHLFGAPQPERIGGAVPPELAAHFVAASLATAAIFWCALGWLSGTFWQKFAGESGAAAAN